MSEQQRAPGEVWLVGAGLAPTARAAVIENDTYVHQRIVSGTLATLPDRVPGHQLSGPALVVIGEVVGLYETLAWFGRAAAAVEPMAGHNME